MSAAYHLARCFHNKNAKMIDVCKWSHLKVIFRFAHAFTEPFFGDSNNQVMANVR